MKRYVPKRGSPWTLERLRERAYREQRGLCYWCGREMLTNGPMNHALACTADHLIPRYAGGLTKPGNIVAACRKCNSSRQKETNRPPKAEAVFTAGDTAHHSPFARLKRNQS